MKKPSIRPLILLTSLSFLGLSGFTSCVPLAVGAAGGYILSEEGYEVQSPIKKD